LGDVLAEDGGFFIFRGGDPVFTVAVDTERGIDVPGEGLTAVDAGAVFFEDPFVTAAAGLGLLGHKVGFSHSPDIMDPVAVGADGRIETESLFEKGLSVDAPHVFLIGRLAVDVVLDDDGHIFVAGSASLRDVLAVDSRFRVCCGTDIVLAVAVPAFGHFADASFKIGPSVDAIRVGQGIKAGPRFLVLPMAG